ncbi:MAG: hypothetical protein ABJE66_26320 [Deltaproteobacteria bacterium]
MKRLALLTILCACGDKRAEPEVTAVNALVPANLQGQLEFVMRDVDELQVMPTKQKWKVAAPKSWEVRRDGGRISPPNQPNDGTLNSRVGSFIALWTEKCESECTPPPRLQAVLSEHAEDIVVNGKPLHRRTQVWSMDGTGDEGVYITVHTWASAGPVYHECKVRLLPELKDAEKAFEAACTLATVN